MTSIGLRGMAPSNSTRASFRTTKAETTQAGKKVGKLRCLPAPGQVIPHPFATEYFVLGSWGEKENEVSLWRVSKDGIQSNIDLNVMQRSSIEPSVTGIVALNHELFGLTTSTGDLCLYKVANLDSEANDPSLELLGSNQLHTLRRSSSGCPATGIATNNNSIVTVGEDSSIYEVSMEDYQISRSLESVDPLSLSTVEYVGRTQIATGNIGGQVNIWDLAVANTKPIVTLNHLEELSGVASIAQHPTQSHVLLVGLNSGTLSIFDLRVGSSAGPTANLQQLKGGVSEVHFHEVSPDHFFTCSQSGDMIHWFPAGEKGGPELVQNNDWSMDLNLEFLKYGLGYKTLCSSPFPMNSMSLSQNNRLICAGDSGVISCIQASNF